MTEDDAKNWIKAHFDVSRETLLQHFADAVIAESALQNLVSASSLERLWARHILDSAQLIALADNTPGLWIDIGTGAGFPGLVIGILTDRPTVLIEPRRKRAAFLQFTVDRLGLSDRIVVAPTRAETYAAEACVISARAVTTLAGTLSAATHLSTANTSWILPKGPCAHEEVAVAQRTWHGTFHVEQSITDPQSLIIIAKGVARR